jgi:serine/threonine protein kinase/tetratricopeptide (TPR) repeat protein
MAKSENSPAAPGTGKTCPSCGRTQVGHRKGTITWWIFNSANCSCGVQNPAATVHPIEEPASKSATLNDEDAVASARLQSALPDLGHRYELLSLLGEGAMGSVYKVRDRQSQSDKFYAIKVLRRELAFEEKAVRRFKQEVAAVSKLVHPNLVYVLGSDVTPDGLPYMVMNFVEGQTLLERLQHGQIPLTQALFMFEELAKGLVHAHSEGIVHRDLKPGNVLLSQRPGNDAPDVRVADFGLAKVSDAGMSALTLAGDRFGSPFYMSPEQCEGGLVDARSDIYSFGCVMYEVLSGSVPFRNHNALAVISDHMKTRPQPLGTVAAVKIPRDLEALVMRCLEKAPGDRYQNAADLLHDLRLIRNGQHIEGITPTFSKGRLRMMAVALAAVVIGGIIFSGTTYFLKHYKIVEQADETPKAKTTRNDTTEINESGYIDSPLETKSVTKALTKPEPKSVQTQSHGEADKRSAFVRGNGKPNDLQELKSLPNVEYLTLNEVNVSSAEPLKQLQSLSQLHVEESTLPDKAFDIIGRLNRLTSLTFFGCQVTDAQLPKLQHLRRLSQLSLDHCENVTFIAFSKLSASMPETAVSFSNDGRPDDSLTGVGETNLNHSNLDALKAFESAFRFARQQADPDKLKLAQIVSRKGFTELLLKQSAAAMSSLQLADKYFQETAPDDLTVVMIAIEKAIIYEVLNDMSAAAASWERAAAIFDRATANGRVWLVADGYVPTWARFEEARILARSGKIDQAVACYKNGRAILQKLHQPYNLHAAMAGAAIGEACLKSNQTKAAQKYFSESYSYFQANPKKSLLVSWSLYPGRSTYNELFRTNQRNEKYAYMAAAIGLARIATTAGDAGDAAKIYNQMLVSNHLTEDDVVKVTEMLGALAPESPH